MTPTKRQLWFLFGLFFVIAVTLILVFIPGSDITLPQMGPADGSQEEPGPAIPADTIQPEEEAPVRHSLAPGDTLRPQDQEWKEALGGVRGRVLESDGIPVSACEIAGFGEWVPTLIGILDGVLGGTEGQLVTAQAKTMTDKDGRFLLTGLFPQEMSVLRLSKDDSTLLTVPLSQTPGPGETIDIGDIVLPDFATITGIVIDRESEQPLPGVKLFVSILPGIAAGSGLLDLHGGEWLLGRFGGGQDPRVLVKAPQSLSHVRRLMSMPAATSDKEGRFTIERAPLGLCSLIGQKSGFAPIRRLAIRTRPGKTTDLGELKITSENRVLIAVVDETGAPVVGARVMAGIMPALVPVAILTPLGKTDQAGNVAGSGFPTGVVYVAAARENEAWTIGGPFKMHAKKVVTLGQGCKAQFLCVTKQKAAEVPVEFTGITLTSLLDTRSLSGHVKTEPKGIIKLSGLPRGGYQLRVKAKDCREQLIGVFLPEMTATEDKPKKIYFDKGFMLPVFVRDALGNPVKGARIMPLPDDAFRGAMPSFDPAFKAFYSDDQGRVELGPLAPGRHLLGAWHPRLGSTFSKGRVPAKEPIVITLAPGRIEGWLDPAGRDPKGKQWQVFLINEEAPMPFQTCLVSDKGTFVFPQVAPGRHELMLYAGLQVQPLEELFYSLASERKSALAEERVKVGPGETVKVTLQLPGAKGNTGAVDGYITKDGQPVAGIEVVAGLRGRRLRGVSGPDGAYQIIGIQAGTTYLRAGIEELGLEGEIRSVASATVDVVSGGRIRQDFHIFGGSIEGLVVDSDGQPLPSVLVCARPNKVEGNPGRVNCLTGNDGTFKLTLMAPGVWRINVESENYMTAGTPLVNLPPRVKSAKTKLVVWRKVDVSLLLVPPPVKGTKLRGVQLIPLGRKAAYPINKWLWQESERINISVPVGKYRVKIFEGDNDQYREGVVTVPDPPSGEIKVNLGPAVNMGVVVVPVRFAGQVKDAKGVPPGEGTLNLYRESNERTNPFSRGKNHRVTVGPEGNFSFDIPPGKYSYWVNVKNKKTGKREYRSGKITVPLGGSGDAVIKW